jgi:hypothetical protein
MRFFGTPPIDGAFCEYVVVRQSSLTLYRTASPTTRLGWSSRCRSAPGVP